MLQKLSVRDVRSFLHSLKGTETTRGGEISDRARQQIHTIISSALTHAVREELITRNVARLVEKPQSDPADTQPLSDDELAALLLPPPSIGYGLCGSFT